MEGEDVKTVEHVCSRTASPQEETISETVWSYDWRRDKSPQEDTISETLWGYAWCVGVYCYYGCLYVATGCCLSDCISGDSDDRDI